MTLLNILAILVLIGLNAFFVAVEFAAVASRRSRLDLLAGDHERPALIVRNWLDSPTARERLIAATQLGITVVSLALGAVGENSFEAWLEPVFQDAHLPGWLAALDFILPALPLILSLLIVSSLHVVLGEQVPKVAVLRTPEKFALAIAPVMSVFSTIFKWMIDILDWATRGILRIVGIPDSANVHTAVSLEELKQMVSGPEVEGVIELPEREMLSAVIDFGEMIVRQVSIPRTEIIAIEADAPLSAAVDQMVEHSITKLPIYEEDLDHITGILYLADLARLLRQDHETSETCRMAAREALFVPETIPVNDLLHTFRAARTHVAIVLDEYGGTAGLVTLEDLLEEIIGEVSGPFDEGSPPFVPQPDGSILIDGMTFIEEVNQQLGVEFQDEDYDTIAGFVLGRIGHIPNVGDVIEDPNTHTRLRVEKMDRMRIAQVSLHKVE